MPMIPFASLLPDAVPAPSADWLGMAVRPGSGLGFLPAALSVQPMGTLLTLLLAGAAVAVLPRMGRIAPAGARSA